MTREELAARLNGREYLDEIAPAEEREAKGAGLVIVFGASDDLMEFRGAIHDEIGVWGGAEATVDCEGLMPDFDELARECDKVGLRDYFRREGAGRTIEAVWDEEGYSWLYRTEVPHSTFDVMEDGEKYCRGIVFALADAAEVGGAYQAWLDANRRPQVAPDADPAWIIRYADQDMPDELFSGHGAEEAARRRFDWQRSAWSIRLFQEVARG